MTTSKDRPRDLMGALLIALVLFTALLAGCGRTEAPADDKPTPVRVQQASNGPAVPPIDTNGIVVTKHEMRLSFKVGGQVEAGVAQSLVAIIRGRGGKPPADLVAIAQEDT